MPEKISAVQKKGKMTWVILPTRSSQESDP